MKSLNSDAYVLSADTVVYLNAQNNSKAFNLKPTLSVAEQYKFVQVEVANVQNTQQRFALINVYFLKDGEKTLLGNFSLYPPNNPGTFLVPTQAKLKSGGAIMLSLQLPDGIDGNETVVMGIKAVRLLR